MCLCFLLLLQALSEPLHTANLSTPCRKTLLDVVSALLLAENVSLPETLIKETIEKVTHLAAVACAVNNVFSIKYACCIYR